VNLISLLCQPLAKKGSKLLVIHPTQYAPNGGM
jgi:hypothetical protein